MPYTEDDLIIINKAIASGARRVKFKDREQENFNAEELLELKAHIMSEISRADTTVRRPRSYRIRTSKGL